MKRILQTILFASLTSCIPKSVEIESKGREAEYTPVSREILEGFANAYEICEKLSITEKVNQWENPYLFAQHICETYGVGNYNTYGCEKNPWHVDCNENSTFAFTLDDNIVCYSDKEKCIKISEEYKEINSPWIKKK